MHFKKQMETINNAYCSDKYQYTMGKSYLACGKQEEIAIFNLFYRKAPENNNWAVVSGTEEVLEMVSKLGTEPEDFYEKFLPGDDYAEFRKYLSTMKFTGNVYAMREGEIAFPNQPVVIVEAPLVQAQVLETPMLCILNHQMAVATKASRVCRATTHPVSEFGSRRAHGPWAAVYGAKAAMIAGCASSSNILAGIMGGVPSTGTMAHSYVTSYGSTVKGEYKAFCDYIDTHRGENIILLIDTYDTLRCGVKNAIKAFNAKGIDDSYPYGYGIRLDSGDLAYLSAAVRDILDEAGLKQCKIFATNSLDEYLITDLERQGAKIDSYGVGDAIATSKAAPCFGNVYKLVEIAGEPVLKRSEDKIKLINPGFQRTWRITTSDKNGKPVNRVDVTCLRGDRLDKALQNNEAFTVRDEYESVKKLSFEAGTYTARDLHLMAIENGARVVPKHTLEEKKAFFKANLEAFSPSERRIINPHYYKVDISDDLYDCKMRIINNLIKEIEEFDNQ